MAFSFGKMNDSDATLFIQVSEITGSTQRGAIVDLVKDLKSNNLWSKMKAIYPFVGGTAATHKWNLKDPRDVDAAFRLTFTGGWTHSSNGADPNGTNAYADTYLNASTILVSSNTHQSFYSGDDVDGLYFDIGATNFGSTQIISIYSKYNGNSIGDVGNYTVSRVSGSVSNSQGLYVVSRTSTTSLKLYKSNSTVNSNNTSDTASLPNSTITLSAVLLSGTYQQYSPRQCRFASIGDGLTDTDAANLYTVVQKFQTTLGRQV